MLRSISMVPCNLYMQPAVAFETMHQLGEMNRVQIVDMHSDTGPDSRSYTMDINRCMKIERKLGYFEYEMLNEANTIHIPYPEKNIKPIHPSDMLMFENLIEKWETDIMENADSIAELKHDLIELKELGLIIKEIGPMLDKAQPEMDEMLIKFQESNDPLYHGNVYIVTGVIERSKSYLCQLMLWRISVGNIYYREADHDLFLEDPNRGQDIRKVAFMAACQGEELRSRMEKVCTSFKATFYPCPRCPKEREEMLYKIEDRIEELESVLSKSKFYRCMALRSIGKQWRGWLIQVRKTRMIYENMNLMVLDMPKNCLIGRCWVPNRDIQKVQQMMDECTKTMGVRAPSVITKVENSESVPPTLQHTNKFTQAPQDLVNAYGHARYKEINPALFMIVGLPFLFGVMFSDMGHGLIITAIALWLIAYEDELEEKVRGNEIFELLFAGRYVLLLMGLWGIYAGFCFNQLFTKSLNLSSTNSMYKNVYTKEDLQKSNGKITMGGKARVNQQYIWGTDPMWAMSKNGVIMKSGQLMKLSIIIGTLHMLFGVLLSAFNHRYFKNSYAIFVQSLPQFLFLMSTFGWTVFLIYYKWFTYYDGAPMDLSPQCAPSIIPLVLARIVPMTVYEPKACSSIFFFGIQPSIELCLNLVAILSILLLLFGTPLYIHLFNLSTKKNLAKEMRVFRGRHMKGCKLACKSPCGDMCDDACRKQEEKWQAVVDRHSTPFGKLLANQLIYTLDFVLGIITHIASYLRLWALALGHYLIADSLWIMVLRNMALRSFNVSGIKKLVFAFAVYAILTFIVLVVMEAMCGFLHALRLHWVEFMSKFYVDEGTPFKPYNFKNVSPDMYVKSTDTKYAKRCLRRCPQAGFFKCKVNQ